MKFKLKQPVKKKTKQKSLSKKERNVDKQEWTSPVCKRVWKESQTDWNVCRIFTLRGYEGWYILYPQ